MRKEGGRRRSGARERLRRLRTPALRADIDQRDKCDSRRPQPQRLNKGTKKEVIASIKIRLCMLHSGAAARFPLRNRDIGDNKALCAPTDLTAKLRVYARTRKSYRNKNRNIFQHRTILRTKRGGKKQDYPIITTNKGTFLHLLPHSARRRVIQFVRPPLRLSHTLTRVYAHSVVFRLLPSPFTSHPYSIQNVTIRCEGFAFVRSSPSSPEKRNPSHRLLNDKFPSVRRLGMGELLHFSSFTVTFTRITLILCNLRPPDCSKLGEAKNGSPSPFHFPYSIGNERIRSQSVKR